MPRQHRANRPGPPALIVTWNRLGRAAGYSRCRLLCADGPYLLDVTGALALQTQYQVTERGLQQDLIDYYINYNDRMQSIWWNVALRDVLGPLGYLALMVLILALLHVAGTGNHARSSAGREADAWRAGWFGALVIGS